MWAEGKEERMKEEVQRETLDGEEFTMLEIKA